MQKQLNKLSECVRDAIVEYLDRFRFTCRADLVGALFINKPTLSDLWDCLPWSKWYGGISGCRAEARKCGACYCGKFSRPGFFEQPRFVVHGLEDDDYRYEGSKVTFGDAP